MAELFEQRVLHGSHKVIAKLSVALVAAQLLLGQDVVFLLAAVLFHGTDELITLEDGISLLVLNTRQLFFVREASILAPNGNGSLSQKAVHSIEDHSPITVSTLVSLRVPDQAVKHLLHELAPVGVDGLEHLVETVRPVAIGLRRGDARQHQQCGCQQCQLGSGLHGLRPLEGYGTDRIRPAHVPFNGRGSGFRRAIQGIVPAT